MHIHVDTYGEKSPIDEKIELLRDFCILRKNANKQEEAIRNILAGCKSEIQMEQKLHNVLHGKESLKDLINRESMHLVRQI